VSAEMIAANVLTFGALRRKAIFSLWNRLHNNDNEIINSIMCSDSFYKSELRLEWINLVYSPD